MRRKTPQEKKRESYLRDRRNTYGENDKSSRKNIPLRKRLRSRSERRLARTAFAAGNRDVDLDWVEEVEGRLVQNRRSAWWRKSPDEPLAGALARTLAYRVETGMLSEEQASATLERIRTATRRRD